MLNHILCFTVWNTKTTLWDTYSQCEIQIPQCETENSSKRSELCFSEFVIICRGRCNFLIEIIGYAINLYNFVLQAYRGYD